MNLVVLSLKQVGSLTPIMQLIIICILFAVSIFTQRKEYKKTGKTYGRYPWRISTFFSSIYEEIIFRWLIFYGLMIILPISWSITISSVLFGLWHIKNYKWQTKKQTLYQVIYTGIVFGPIASIVTLWSGTIWIAVIIHYLNNLFIDTIRKIRYNI